MSTAPVLKRLPLMLSLGTAVCILITGCRSGATETSSSPSKCDYEKLRVSPQGAVGATGHMGLTVLVDNPTAKTCELSGYPELRLLDGDDHTMGSVIKGQGFLTGTREPVSVVSIAPGGHASFTVEWQSVRADNELCTAGVRLGVTLPGATDEVLLPAQSAEGLAIAPCGSGLAVSPILPSRP